MQAHIVLAHPEPKSFNGHLAGVAREALEARGWGVGVSDLHAMGFDPVERPEHYADPGNPARFTVQDEQRLAGKRGTLPALVRDEIGRLDAADLVILQYPMWWHLPPAMLKGWFDRVFAYGEVYASKRRFENGRFKGKRAMVSVSVGTSRETYAHDGRSGDIDLLLWPVHFTLAYVGFTVLEPFVAYGVEAGIRYSDPAVMEDRFAGIENDLRARLANIEAVPIVPFNRMEEWGADGRVKPGTPSHSPFIRAREHLVLDGD